MKKFLSILIPSVLIAAQVNASSWYDDDDSEALRMAIEESLTNKDEEFAALAASFADLKDRDFSDSEEEDPGLSAAILASLTERIHNGHNSAPRNEPIRYKFGIDGNHHPWNFESVGLSGREGPHTWTEGENRMVIFTIPYINDLTGSRVREVVFENVGVVRPQIVNVLFNNDMMAPIEFTAQQMTQSITIPFPADLMQDAVIAFLIPDACQPREIDRCNIDPRILGLRLSTAVVKYAEEDRSPAAAAAPISSSAREEKKPINNGILSDVTNEHISQMNNIFVEVRKEFSQKLIALEEQLYRPEDRKLPLLAKWLQYDRAQALRLATGTVEYDDVFNNYETWKKDVKKRTKELERIAIDREIECPQNKEYLKRLFCQKYNHPPELAAKVYKKFMNGGL